MAKKLTSAKAKKILHDKSVHGHPLTEQQRKFFGAIAGGAEPYKAEGGAWLDKYEAQDGTILDDRAQQYLSGRTGDLQSFRPRVDVDFAKNIAAARKRDEEAALKAIAPKPSFIGPADTRVSTQLIKKELAEQRAKREAQQRSALAQTFGSFTPTGSPAAGAIGAEMFVNLNPITAPATSAGRLTQQALGENPYGFGESTFGNILGGVGILGDVFSAGMVPGMRVSQNAPLSSQLSNELIQQTTPLITRSIVRGPIPNPYKGEYISGRLERNVVGEELPEHLRPRLIDQEGNPMSIEDLDVKPTPPRVPTAEELALSQRLKERNQRVIDAFRNKNVSNPQTWQMKELPGLHLKSTMSEGPISKIVEPKTGLVNVEQALGIIGKESGGKEKVSIIKKALGNTPPQKMDYNEFRKTIQDQLVPLERQFSTKRSDYGINNLGYNRGWSADWGGSKMEVVESLPIENQTLILSNKGKFGKGSDAHGNPEETLGHIHFLRDAETPDVLTVTQIQSDAFQGKLRTMAKNKDEALLDFQERLKNAETIEDLYSKAKPRVGNDGTVDLDFMGRPIWYELPNGQVVTREIIEDVPTSLKKTNELRKIELENFEQKSLLDKSHQERYLQEIMSYAGERGMNKLRLPTSETAAKVQGYRQRDYDVVFKELEDLRNGNISDVTKLSSETKAVITGPGNTSLVDISKGTPVPRNYKDVVSDLDNNKDFASFLENKKGIKGYDPEHQTILKKYLEQPKIIKKLFGAEPKKVTDSKGNTWYEIDVPKSFKEGKGEIKAFEQGGWLDKYEQGGMVLKQKTKDNYGTKPNPNEVDVSLPPGFVGLAYNTKGRNYSPAWGGQFAMGGSIPGAVGFTYARTAGAAPSNGPYAKKTKASAQNGQEMKYYQEGLDFKPKTISQDGSEIPVDSMGYWNPENVGNPVIIPSNEITMEGVDQPLIGISDTGDVQYMEPGEDYEFDGEYVTEYPVAQAGIRTLPNVTVKDKKKPIIVSNPNDPRLKAYQDSLYLYNEANRISDLLRSKGYDINKADWVSKEGNFYATRYRKDKSDMPDMLKMYEAAARLKFPKPISTNLAVRSTNNGQGVRFYDIDLYAKPKQKVEYIKPEPKPEPEVEYKPRPRVEAELPRTSIGDLSYNLPKASAQPSKTKKITTQKDEPERTKKTPVKDFLEDMRLRMEDRKMERKTKRGIKSQLKCFSGVCYDDEGNIVQAKDGVSVNNADAQPLKKLDQLLNFTNYNKPTKGGWLDKYQ